MVLCQNKDEGRVSMDAAILWWQIVMLALLFEMTGALTEACRPGD